MTSAEHEVVVEAGGGQELPGRLASPEQPRGLIIFAHGSGSSRLSPRNQFVAARLQREGLATLLFDLLTAGEEQRERAGALQRFDIEFLSERLEKATAWAIRQTNLHHVHIGYFGASTGAAAALQASLAPGGGSVGAIVSRGGRPDLAGAALERVRAATLLIVGGADRDVLELNRAALARLGSPVKQISIVAGATHLFEEPGALEVVAELASRWFARHLAERREAA